MLLSSRLRSLAAPCVILLAWTLLPPPAAAAPPADAPSRNAVIGEPTALVVQPEALRLGGPRTRQQVIVTGKYADGSVRDLTAVCEFTCEGDAAEVSADGFLTPRKNGNATLVAKAGAAVEAFHPVESVANDVLGCQLGR